MSKKTGIVVVGVMLSMALTLGIRSTGRAEAETESTQTPAATATAAADTASGSAINVSKIKISKKKIIMKAGKKTSLSVKGTSSSVVWTSSNKKVAKVTSKGVVKGIKAGTAVVTAKVNGVTRSCKVTIVEKMSKKDFSKFTGENFVAYCKRMGYDGGYAWKGQWKGDSKKRSTYRGIKIDASKTSVEKVYGEFTLSKCKSSDPFTKMKGLKKNKVKYYNDEKWGKYRIRFYYNSKKKVVAIILACNIGNIKKSSLSSYL